MISEQKEYSDAWNKVAPKEEEVSFDVSKFESPEEKTIAQRLQSDEAIKVASGNGLSMPTNIAIGKLNREIEPVKEEEKKPPSISKQYVRLPGVQPMTSEQDQSLQAIRKRRELERQRLMGQ
jgi:hypothetical protein